jgi:hypothetical protein
MLGAIFFVRGRLITLEPKPGDSEQNHEVQSREGILGFQINKRLESFAPRYSQSLLLGLLRKQNSSLVLKILTKKPTKKHENSSLLKNSIFRTEK